MNISHNAADICCTSDIAGIGAVLQRAAALSDNAAYKGSCCYDIAGIIAVLNNAIATVRSVISHNAAYTFFSAADNAAVITACYRASLVLSGNAADIV